MLIRKLNHGNTEVIAKEMDKEPDAVAAEDLYDLIEEYSQHGEVAYFVKAKDLWMFVSEEKLENMLYSILVFIDA